MERTLDLPRLYRYLEIGDVKVIRAKTDDQQATYEIAISSEHEVQRWFGKEILSHERSAIDLTLAKRGLALILDHYGPQVGVVENIRLDDDKVLRGEMRFSRSNLGREIEQDVVDGVRKYISCGYDPKRAKLEEKGESLREDKWRVTRWQILESSIVKIPADPTVGVGRSGAEAAEKHSVEIEGSEPVEEVRRMSGTAGQEGGASAAGAPSTRSNGGAAAAPVVEISAEDIRKQEADRAVRISQICRNNGVDRATEEAFVRSGKSAGDVGLEVLDLRLPKPRSNPSAEMIAEMSEGEKSDLRGYSKRKAILQGLALREGRKIVGLEARIHENLLARVQKAGYMSRGGILMPTSLRDLEDDQGDAPDGRQTRTMDSKTATKGPEIVQDQRGDFIEMLRAKTVLDRLGVTMLTGLSGGPIVFPKQLTAMVAQWIGENPPTGVTPSDMTLGVVTLQPKTLMAATSYSRQLLVQSNPSIDGLIDNDSTRVMALALDRAAIHGKGASGEPTGVYNWPGVQSKPFGGTVDFNELVDTLGQLADANADYDTVGWVMTPLLGASFKRTLVAQAAGSEMIWDGTFQEGNVAGYRAVASSQISKTMSGSDDTGGTSHGIVVGVWSDMLVGIWGVLEAITDPYTLASQALIKVTWFQMADLIIRHPESFVKGTGATPA